jgi:hypothetical protein
MLRKNKKDAALWHESGMKEFANKLQHLPIQFRGAFLLLQTSANSIK